MLLNKLIKKHIDLLTYSSKKDCIKNIDVFFKLTKHSRDYTAESVANLRPSFEPTIHNFAMITALMMREKLNKYKLHSTDFFASLGCLNPTQARAMVEACCFSDLAALDGIYLSGWQEASSGENTYGNMFPDQSLYPSNSVPEKIKKIQQVLMSADLINNHRLNNPSLDKKSKTEFSDLNYFYPIIADIEAGFGQEIHTFQLAKSCIEAGAACLHLEDQDGSLKKCGHMGGKVKISIQDFKNKLKAVRLAADVMGTDTVIIGRTDARGTKLINNASDKRDQPFLFYAIDPIKLKQHPYIISHAINSDEWLSLLTKCNITNQQTVATKDATFITPSFKQTLDQTNTSETIYKTTLKAIMSTLMCNQSHAEWLLEYLRLTQPLQTNNGFYRYDCNLDSAISVASAIIDDVDLIWFETSEPDLDEAQRFANAVHAINPKKQLHYNCSPSFNWKSNFQSYFGRNWQKKLASFNKDLASMGYKSQKITLFGMHVINQSMKDWVQEYQTNHMAGYSKLQEREKETNNQSLEHQGFVGVDIWSQITEICQGSDSELLANKGESATMDQF